MLSEIDTAPLPTIFARHKLGSGVQSLWDSEQIAINWGDTPSANPDDYQDRGATEIGKLNEVASEGAIVGAAYRSVHKSKMLVGVIPPGSEVDILFIHEDNIVRSESIEPNSSIEYPEGLPKECTVHKAVQMKDCITVTRQEQPLLFDDGVRPPFWSICDWDGGEDQLRAIIRGELPPYDVGSLTTDQLEIVCEEYLRIVDDSYHRTATIGGTTSDVDIIGASGDDLVWAQVTQGATEKVQRKIKKLGDYTDEEARVIIFAPANSRPETMDENITFIPVEGVFETINLNETGTLLLSRLLGRMD
jgi:hypothetical protein